MLGKLRLHPEPSLHGGQGAQLPQKPGLGKARHMIGVKLAPKQGVPYFLCYRPLWKEACGHIFSKMFLKA